MTVSVDVSTGAFPLTFSVRVEVPDVLIVAGANVAPTPGGSPATASDTGPLNFPVASMDITKELLAPGAIVRAPGVALIVKSPVFTTIETVVVCRSAPLVPVIVKVYVPAGVLVLVETVRTPEVVPVRLAGENPALAPVGNPVMERVVDPENPPSAI